MNINEALNEIFLSKDILQAAASIRKFAESAKKEKNRNTLIKHFKEQFLVHSFYDASPLDNANPYLICDRASAFFKYMHRLLPVDTTPVKYLNELLEFSDSISATFSTKKGSILDKEQVVQIMQYLDKEFTFSERVFNGGGLAYIFIIDAAHSLHNGQHLFSKTDSAMVQRIALYRLVHFDDRIRTTPEAVFFHELSHALHLRLTGGIKYVPDELLCRLKDLCFPTLDQLSTENQCEIFADILSMGLMHNSPFEEKDPFVDIFPDDKAAFKEMAEVMLRKLE